MKVACDVIEFVAVWQSGVHAECCVVCADIARDNADVEFMYAVDARPGICEWCEADAEFGGGDDAE